MNEEDKIEIKKFIESKIKNKQDIVEVLQYITYEFKEVIDVHLVMYVMSLINQNYTALKGDFLLLRKNVSENLTLNKLHTQKELERTREHGIGFYEDTTVKNIMMASTRFGKDKFPIHLPQTDGVLKKYKLSRADLLKAMKEKEQLLKLEDNQ